MRGPTVESLWKAHLAAKFPVSCYGRGPGGMTRDEVEAKFRALEYGGKADGPKGGSEVDDELAQLKKKIRIGS